MFEIAKKGERRQNAYDVHSSNAYPHTVANNYFSVRFDKDTKHEPSGHRSKSSEIAIYHVRDGTIVQEQFL